ncbi:MAG: hypothetical protein ACPF8V_02070, partial [Luteibaculum sp.]
MRFFSLALSLLMATVAIAQNQNDRGDQVQLNSITTAVPFLNIAPDSRASGMGDVGVSTSA